MNPYTVIITGAGGGIGIELVQRFLKLNTLVYALDFKDSAISQLQTLDCDPKLLIIQKIDVGSQDDVKKFFKIFKSAPDSTDILVNNAGILSNTSFLNLTIDQLQATLACNFLGAFHMIQAMLPHMIERKRGRIVNVASVAARKGIPGLTHYAASKAALVAMTRCLATEFASSNIQVNAVSPGFLDTPMAQENKVVVNALTAFRTPAKRLGTAAEVAEVILNLALQSGTYQTGTEVVIDGGYSIT